MTEIPFRAAAVQLNSTSDEDRNWATAQALIREAASRGARFIVTPENTNFLGPHREKVRRAEPLDGKTCVRFGKLAAECEAFLLLGSFNERSDEPDRCYNTSVLFDPKGRQIAVYRKIHLFDIDLSEEVSFQESATIKPGEDVVVARTDLGRLGLSICYDLRFPELYRKLTEDGAELLCVPSAFTRTTGKAHWKLLLCARAVENQCFVLAAAQCGEHDDQGLRQSWGHSAIIDPWGEVLAMAEEEPGVVIAELNLERLSEVRRAMPVAEHRRL
ncbi:MAG: carbon-nitrogen hydrolase family protein [Acidobacteria bacterium]|nr:carbon-nitrogen hydrolase family protein [Acidobacteriota bacterium]